MKIHENWFCSVKHIFRKQNCAADALAVKSKYLKRGAKLSKPKYKRQVLTESHSTPLPLLELHRPLPTPTPNPHHPAQHIHLLCLYFGQNAQSTCILPKIEQDLL
ncbi:unnamed protein product [Prunus armeniaca]|uniref:RNase H type-1 domain-containing protein n=1 Tax=Prunus armeniaca TaxID=36596 RepID=A0A6J5W804_PRUAR|nr:unnamed protein product [Prunus armeniaca]